MNIIHNDILSRYWARSHAIKLRDGLDLSATVAIVGAEADAIGTASGFGKDFVDDMGWLVGYLTWPCDAVYVCASFDVEVDLVIGWSHLIAANKTATACLSVDPIGCKFVAHEVEAEYDDRFFEPLLSAAHDFDSVRQMDGDTEDRKVSRDMVRRHNGTNYDVELLPPGHVLELARHMAVST